MSTSNQALDEVRTLCRRVLGAGPAANEAAARAFVEAGPNERLAVLAAALRACDQLATDGRGPSDVDSPSPGLADAVARELAAASARLPARQRSLLALRERLGLSYEEIASVVGTDPPAVASLLAQARLQLRDERRGGASDAAGCEQRERVLSIVARRQDGEPRAPADDDWLMDHLVVCRSCEEAHAAMLESSVCYRAWQG